MLNSDLCLENLEYPDRSIIHLTAQNPVLFATCTYFLLRSKIPFHYSFKMLRARQFHYGDLVKCKNDVTLATVLPLSRFQETMQAVFNYGNTKIKHHKKEKADLAACFVYTTHHLPCCLQSLRLTIGTKLR